MSPDQDGNESRPGKESEPTKVREPDNTRSPREPTPRHAQKPQSVDADAQPEGE